MADLGFLGMRGTGDWVTDQRPKNWRETILRLYPNGMAPLTAITSKMKSEPTDDPEFNWWKKSLRTQTADVTGVYTETTLTTEYVSGGVDDDNLFLKMSLADSKHFRGGHLLLLRYSEDPLVDVVAKCTLVVPNGANSYICARLQEADDNSPNFDLSNCNKVQIIGNVNPEGGERREAVTYDPTKYYNYTSIKRNSLDITRTARRTKLRGPQAYQEAKREALELHSIEIEKESLFSTRRETTGENGKPERSSYGIIPYIRDYQPGNVFNFVRDADVAGETWKGVGEDWLNEKLEVLFRYGRQEKLGLCGSGALLGIQKIVKEGAQYNISKRERSYGIQVVEWVTPFGVLNLKTHPLFSYEATDRHSIVVLEPQNLVWRYIDDTFFVSDPERRKTSQMGIDGTQEEFITEGGYEIWYPETMGYFLGIGQNNVL